MSADIVYPATDELEFLIVAQPQSHFCDFKCYKVIATTDEGPIYLRKDYDDSHDVVTTRDEAQIYLQGHISWDGCADLRFDEQDNVMLHFCGLEHAKQVGKLLERLYAIAAEVIPSWDKELAA